MKTAATVREPAEEAARLVRRLLTPSGLADPYAVYDELRQVDAGAARSSRFVVRHEEVRAALRDRSLSSDRVDAILRPLGEQDRHVAAPLEAALREIVAFLDPPEHRRVRELLGAAFTPAMSERQRPRIRRLVHRLLDDAPRRGGTIDLHAALSYPLPSLVVGEMLGIPEGDVSRFGAWARDLVYVVGSGNMTAKLAERATRSVLDMREFVAELVCRRRESPGDDLLTALIAASDDGETLQPDQLAANALFLMTAGHETATNMLSNSMLALLRNPDAWETLLGAPHVPSEAVEELIRFDSPVQIAARITPEDREFFGRTLRAGEPLILLLGAANHDPEVFPEPHQLRLDRAPNPHLSFSHSAHFCLGATLARAELSEVLAALFERFPRMGLATEQIHWQPTLDFRGPLALPVHLGTPC